MSTTLGSQISVCELPAFFNICSNGKEMEMCFIFKKVPYESARLSLVINKERQTLCKEGVITSNTGIKPVCFAHTTWI